MKSLVQNYKELLEEQGIGEEDYDIREGENAESLRLQVAGKYAPISLCAIFVEEESLFVIFSTYDKEVPEEKYAKMALYIAETNFALKTGGLELNLENGQVMMRHSQYLFYEEEQDLKDVLLLTMKLNLTTYEEYYEKIMEIIEQ
ncbi:MAG: hypothetical protein RSB37_00705 [Acetivibrio sp.]